MVRAALPAARSNFFRFPENSGGVIRNVENLLSAEVTAQIVTATRGNHLFRSIETGRITSLERALCVEHFQFEPDS